MFIRRRRSGLFSSFGAPCLAVALAVSVAGCSKTSTMADGATAQGAGGESGRGGREGGRGGGGRGGAGGGAVIVTTTSAIEKPMAVDVRAVGNVEAASTVDIRPQVSGQLLTVNFTEGQEVTAGQLLFTIDPRPFEVALQQAEAALARDTAQSKGIAAQLARVEELLKQQLTAKSDRDALATQYAMSQASIALDTAQVESAKLQLQYTKITSPVSGRTGAVLVHPGSLVRTNDTAPLVVINQLSPAFVSFTVPSKLLAEIRRVQGRGLKVTASPSGSTAAGVTGTVTFVDNAIDPGSDTVRLKATFANGNRALWPGQFVDVTLQLAVHPRAVVIPVAAVQAGQQGQFVFVVKPDSTVDVRPVKVGWIDGNDVVIETGVAAGDVVVTDGQLRLVPGARVSVRSGPGQSGSTS